jgi:hypothetical protein
MRNEKEGKRDKETFNVIQKEDILNIAHELLELQ